jgi:flagellar hook assembly protein FlgD
VAPNPARGVVRMALEVPHAARVRIQVLDVQGRVAATIADGAYSAGHHEVAWRGAAAGRRTRPGLYWLRMQAEGRTFTQRFLLLE